MLVIVCSPALHQQETASGFEPVAIDICILLQPCSHAGPCTECYTEELLPMNKDELNVTATAAAALRQARCLLPGVPCIICVLLF